MSLEELIRSYGYPALFVGTFLEGETVLVAAGFAAHRGYLSLPWVMVWAFLGTLFSDQLWFLVGHRRGQQLLARHPRWHAKAERVRNLVHRHHLPVILGFRFLYGVRNVAPLVIGSLGFDPKRFVILNFLGAGLWSVLVALGGYLFGEVLERVLKDIQRHEAWVFAGILIVGVAVWFILHVTRRITCRRIEDEGGRGRSRE